MTSTKRVKSSNNKQTRSKKRLDDGVYCKNESRIVEQDPNCKPVQNTEAFNKTMDELADMFNRYDINAKRPVFLDAKIFRYANSYALVLPQCVDNDSTKLAEDALSQLDTKRIFKYKCWTIKKSDLSFCKERGARQYDTKLLDYINENGETNLVN
jgi:hypothetical protein